MNAEHPAGNFDERLIDWAGARTPVLTRTRRLARALRNRVALLLADRGYAVAETPVIERVDEWLEGQWQKTLPGEVLLGRIAERVLWEHIITEDIGSEVLDPAGLAAQAAEAWTRINEWHEPVWEEEPLSIDCAAFRRWLRRFRGWLRDTGYLTSAELSGRVTRAIGDGTLTLDGTDRVVFLGFERFDPWVVCLHEMLAARGIAVECPAWLHEGQAEVELRCYADRGEEVRAVARRVRADIEQQPECRVGIVVAGMTDYVSLLERRLTAELDPQAVLPGGSRHTRPFDLAEAPALADYPLIAHALDILELQPADNGFTLASRVLLAPYPRRRADDTRATEEHEARALIEADLRNDNRTAVALMGPGGIHERACKVGAVAFAERIAGLCEVLSDLPSRQPPRAWASHFVDRVQAMGWPGRGIKGAEGVAYDKWREAIGELTALEAVAPEMSCAEAVERLRQICQSERVQPPSFGLQIQVMELLESTGLSFDRLYVLGLAATAFPEPVRPNALLPAVWQRRVRMRRASPEGELEFAGELWERLLHSAPVVHASYARRGDGDEELTVSPLLGGYEAQTSAGGEPISSPLTSSEDNQPVTETRPADVAEPALVRSGGTSLLVNQSRCPFMALAATRLRAEPLREPQPEPTALTRGLLLHRALELASRRLPGKAALSGASDAEVLAAAGEAAGAALESRAGRVVPAHLRAPTAAWLQEMVAGWLSYEREERDGDWEITACEERVTLELAVDEGEPVVMRGRIDRIDSLATGGSLIIDYKSGAGMSKTAAWLGERPSDLQLPIYAESLTQSGQEVAGIAFAKVVARDSFALDGLCDTDITGRLGPPPRGRHAAEWQGWPAQRASSGALLRALAADFARGEAAVDPVINPRACRTCGRQALCRVFETTAAEAEEEAE